ncbi:MAG: apolipoprotein N-acyltransferase [Pyrinomonadaceae bacterium]
MKLNGIVRLLPSWQNALLAVLAACLLILAFPPFEWWFTAWFALVPLLWAIEREESVRGSFILGWLFGIVFFYGTCWWLTFAPITYAGFPPVLAYVLMLVVAAIVGLFPAAFAAIMAVSLKRFGSIAILAAPFVWVFTEFLRYWLTGNNWNAIGYSQAFFSAFEPSSVGIGARGLVQMASLGGVYLTGFFLLSFNSTFLRLVRRPALGSIAIFSATIVAAGVLSVLAFERSLPETSVHSRMPNNVVTIQPNVPMSGLTLEKWRQLRQRHVRLAESALSKLDPAAVADGRTPPITVIFPESPMNFQYEDDPESREFINSFAAKHNVSVLFNSAEPDLSNGKYFNSAVLVSPEGKEVTQYDKIFLVPFGEAVPFPLDGFVPGLVGNFSYGSEYDLFPLGDVKAGVMLCFESHFGQLSREFVRNGADVIIEMTNDGYLGPTPVLRQHMANAVFRAVETNRPVLRATNIGITAYINERGEVSDTAEPYTEATRVWTVARSDGSQTFYVRYGDWFAWLSSIVTLVLLAFSYRRKHDR